MSNITADFLPSTYQKWKAFAKEQGLSDPENASLYTYEPDLKSGSKFENTGFALLRVICRSGSLPFAENRRSLPNSHLIVHRKYVDLAERNLAPSKPRRKYLEWIEHSPYSMPTGSEAEELGSYLVLLQSQLLTKGLTDRFDTHSPIDFSPILTRNQRRQAASDEASRQSLGLHSVLGLDPQDQQRQISLLQISQPQQLPQTPPRQTRREVLSPDAMDTDQASASAGIASPDSTVEQPSPLSGEAAKQEPKLESEQEAVINGLLAARISSNTFEELKPVEWAPIQKPYTVTDKKGEKQFTAAVDGIVKVGGVDFGQVTMEMKRVNRYTYPQYAAACKAQEACEMFGAVANLPPDRIKRLREIGQQGKHIIFTVNKSEYWFNMLVYPIEWADYARGNEATFSLATVYEFGPYHSYLPDHMDQVTIILHAISHAVKNGDIEGFKVKGLDPEALDLAELGLEGSDDEMSDEMSDDEGADDEEMI